MTCIFCHHLEEEQILFLSEHFKVVLDIDPIQTGHLLIISKDHIESLTELSSEQLQDLSQLQIQLIHLLEQTLPIDGVTIASNDRGLMAPGTHFHVHLIPRQAGDGFWDELDLPKENWNLEPLHQQLKTLT